MQLAVIGIGNAGSKIADRLLEVEYRTGRSLTQSVLAINTATVDLERLQEIPEPNRLLFGQTDERSKGHGVGGDPDLGAEVIRNDLYELDRTLDEIPLYDVDAFFVIAGLGGGTGSGGAHVISTSLQEKFDVPVYGLGVLPSEEEGGRASLNAARSLQSFVDATDNLMLFDNNYWRGSGRTVGDTYAYMNTEIAKRVVTLLGAGEIDGTQVSENAMDASDINRTLATGGVSVLGYHEADLTDPKIGLLDRLRDGQRTDRNGTDAATKVSGVIRQAVRSRLTCNATVSSAERSLAVVSGPPEEFSRKGLESGRRWLEDTTESVEVLAGDDPRADATALSAVVLLSNVTQVPRISALKDQAVEANRNIDEQSQSRESEIAELLQDEHNELDPV